MIGLLGLPAPSRQPWPAAALPPASSRLAICRSRELRRVFCPESPSRPRFSFYLGGVHLLLEAPIAPCHRSYLLILPASPLFSILCPHPPWHSPSQHCRLLFPSSHRSSPLVCLSLSVLHLDHHPPIKPKSGSRHVQRLPSLNHN